MKNPQYPTPISQELKDTLISHENIKNVYFDIKGKHYFNVHKLLSHDEKELQQGVEKMYGRGEYSHSRVIPGSWNVEKIKEHLSKGIEKTQIVNILTRDEILEIEDEKDTEDGKDNGETGEKKVVIPSPTKKK